MLSGAVVLKDVLFKGEQVTMGVSLVLPVV